jgi:hypothetical protein
MGSTNENNLYQTAASTIINYNYGGSLNISPHIKAPSFNAAYRVNDRVSKNEALPRGKIEDVLTTLIYGMNWRFPTVKDYYSTIGGSYTTADRVTKFTQNSIQTNIVSGYFIQELKIPLTINLQYNTYDVVSPIGTLQKMINNSAGVNYRINKTRTSLGLFYSTSQNKSTLYTSKNNRSTTNFTLRQDLLKGLNIYLDAGLSNYLDTEVTNNYDENYINGGINYTF